MTKYKNIPCPICGTIKKGKRKVCLDCKTKYPSRKSSRGEAPFNRLEEAMRKDRR